MGQASIVQYSVYDMAQCGTMTLCGLAAISDPALLLAIGRWWRVCGPTLENQ